jgi:hypothetical protein
MKKLFALALAALSFLLFAPIASAQPLGTWAYCNGVYRFGNCGGPTMQQYQSYAPQMRYIQQPQYVQQPQYYGNQPQYMGQPQYGNPGYNNGFSNCTVLGAGVGGVVGNRIDHHGLGGTIAGAIIGGALGSMACTNNQGQRVIVQQPQAQYREEFSNPPMNYERRGGIPCTVKVVKGDNAAEETFNVVTPRDCKIAGGLVDEVRTMGNNNSNAQRVSDEQGNRSAVSEKLKLEETVLKSSGKANTCRLRVRGAVVNEVNVPANVAEGDETKKFCDAWQRKEAAARGLL